MVPLVSPTCVFTATVRKLLTSTNSVRQERHLRSSKQVGGGVTMRKREEFSSHSQVVAKTFLEKKKIFYYFWLETDCHELNLDPAALWTFLASN